EIWTAGDGDTTGSAGGIGERDAVAGAVDGRGHISAAGGIDGVDDLSRRGESGDIDVERAAVGAGDDDLARQGRGRFGDRCDARAAVEVGDVRVKVEGPDAELIRGVAAVFTNRELRTGKRIEEIDAVGGAVDFRMDIGTGVVDRVEEI